MFLDHIATCWNDQSRCSSSTHGTWMWSLQWMGGGWRFGAWFRYWPQHYVVLVSGHGKWHIESIRGVKSECVAWVRWQRSSRCWMRRFSWRLISVATRKWKTCNNVFEITDAACDRPHKSEELSDEAMSFIANPKKVRKMHQVPKRACETLQRRWKSLIRFRNDSYEFILKFSCSRQV